VTDYSKEMIAKAEIFAGKAHEGQMRKGGNDVPYIAHPIAVASILKANNATTEAVLGGLLHDVVEDTPVTLKEIGDAFGLGVQNLVEYVTEEKTSNGERLPWRDRKVAYLEMIGKAPYDAVLIAAADKVANARDMVTDYQVIGEELWNIFNADKENQFWYYTTLISIFEIRSIPPGMILELKDALRILHNEYV